MDSGGCDQRDGADGIGNGLNEGAFQWGLGGDPNPNEHTDCQAFSRRYDVGAPPLSSYRRITEAAERHRLLGVNLDGV